MGASFAPYYLGVASAVEKAGELAAGVEAWLVGSVPPGIVEVGEGFDSAVRLQLTTVEFGSVDESAINRLFQVSAAMRCAYRGAAETTRLLSMLENKPTVRACFALAGDALATQARLAPPPGGPFDAACLNDNRRRSEQTERAIGASLIGLRRETMAGGSFEVRRMQRAALFALSVAGESFQQVMELLCR